MPRIDVWFELHNLDHLESGVTVDFRSDWTRDRLIGKVKDLEAFKGPVFMQKKHPSVPGSTVFPFQQLIDKFGREFQCSPSWMMAYAISLGYGTIGLYGVELNAGDEKVEQRPSMKYFIGWARALGIKVIIPEASALARCNFIYAFEDDKIHAFNRYKDEWDQRKLEIENNIESQKLELARMQGVGEVMEMFKDNQL